MGDTLLFGQLFVVKIVNNMFKNVDLHICIYVDMRQNTREWLQLFACGAVGVFRRRVGRIAVVKRSATSRVFVERKFSIVRKRFG